MRPSLLHLADPFASPKTSIRPAVPTPRVTEAEDLSPASPPENDANVRRPTYFQTRGHTARNVDGASRSAVLTSSNFDEWNRLGPKRAEGCAATMELVSAEIVAG